MLYKHYEGFLDLLVGKGASFYPIGTSTEAGSLFNKT